MKKVRGAVEGSAIGIVIGAVFAMVSMFGPRGCIAGAVPIKTFIQAPVQIQYGKTVMGKFYEDGGTSYASIIANGYIPGTLRVDGGSDLRGPLTVEGNTTLDGGLTVTQGLVVAGTASIDGGVILGQGLTVGGASVLTGPATFAATGIAAIAQGRIASLDRISADGGMDEFVGLPIPAVSKFTGPIGTHGLTLKANTAALLDGGLVVTYTTAFAYQDGGPPVCYCTDTTAGAPEAIACRASSDGTTFTAYGAANSVHTFDYFCVGPQ